MFIVYSREELEVIKDEPVLLKKCMLDTYGFVLKQLDMENLRPSKESLMFGLNIFCINYLLTNYDLTKEEKICLLPFFGAQSEHPIIDDVFEEKEQIECLKSAEMLFYKTIISKQFFCNYFDLILRQKQSVNSYSISNIVKNSAMTWGVERIKSISFDMLLEFPEIFETLTKEQLNSKEIKPLKRKYLQKRVSDGKIYLNDMEDFTFEPSDRELLINILDKTFEGGMLYKDLLSFDGAQDLISKKEFFEKYNCKDFSGWTNEDVKENREFIRDVWLYKIEHGLLSNESEFNSAGVEAQFFLEIPFCDKDCLEVVLDEVFLKKLIENDWLFLSLNSLVDENKLSYFSILLSRVLTDEKMIELNSIVLSDFNEKISNCLNGVYSAQVSIDFLESYGTEVKCNYDVFYKNLFDKLPMDRFGDLSSFYVAENVLALNSLYELTLKEPDFNKIYLLCNVVSSLVDYDCENESYEQFLKLNLKTKEEVLFEIKTNLLKKVSSEELKFLKNVFFDILKTESIIDDSPFFEGSSLVDNKTLISNAFDNEDSSVTNDKEFFVKKSLFNINYSELLRFINNSLTKDILMDLLESKPWESSELTTLYWLKKNDKNFDEKIIKSDFLNQNLSDDFKRVLILFSLLTPRLTFMQSKSLVHNFEGNLFEYVLDYLKNNRFFLNENKKFLMNLQRFDLIERHLFSEVELEKQEKGLLEQLFLLVKEKRIISKLITKNIGKSKVVRDFLKDFFRENGLNASQEAAFYNNYSTNFISEKSVFKIKSICDDEKRIAGEKLVENYNNIIKDNLILDKKIKELGVVVDELVGSLSQEKAQRLVRNLLKNENFETLCFTGQHLFTVIGEQLSKSLVGEHFKTYDDEKVLFFAKNEYWAYFVLNVLKYNFSEYSRGEFNCIFSFKKEENYDKFFDLMLSHFDTHVVKEKQNRQLFLLGASGTDEVSAVTMNNSVSISEIKSSDYLFFDEKNRTSIFDLFDFEDEVAVNLIKKNIKKFFFKELFLMFSLQKIYSKKESVFFNKEDVFEIFKKLLNEIIPFEKIGLNNVIQDFIEDNYGFARGKRSGILEEKSILSRKKAYEDLVEFSKCDPMFHVFVCNINLLSYFLYKSKPEEFKFVVPVGLPTVGHVSNCGAAPNFSLENSKEYINKYAETLFDKGILIEGIRLWGDYFSKTNVNSDANIYISLIESVASCSFGVHKQGIDEVQTSTWRQNESLKFVNILYENNCSYLFKLNSVGSFSNIKEVVPALISEGVIGKEFFGSEVKSSNNNDSSTFIVEVESENVFPKEVGVFRKNSLVEKVLFFKDINDSKQITRTVGTEKTYHKYLESVYLYCLKNKDKMQFEYMMWLNDLYEFMSKHKVGQLKFSKDVKDLVDIKNLNSDKIRKFNLFDEIEKQNNSFEKCFERLHRVSKSETLKKALTVVDSFFKIQQSLENGKKEAAKKSFRL